MSRPHLLGPVVDGQVSACVLTGRTQPMGGTAGRGDKNLMVSYYSPIPSFIRNRHREQWSMQWDTEGK